MLPDLGKRIHILRTSAKVSARELDRVAGICRGYTALIEAGHRPNVGGDVLVSLANALGCTLDYLATGKGEAPTPEQVREALATAKAACASEQLSA